MANDYSVFIPIECIDLAFNKKVFEDNNLTFEYIKQLVEFINYQDEINNDKRKYPNLLGKYSAIGITPSGNIISEQLELDMHKLHVALDIDNLWLKKPGYKRTSDNYLVYAKHTYISNTILLLGIISPDAHDLLLPEECMKKRISSPLMKKCMASVGIFQKECNLAQLVNSNKYKSYKITVQ